MDDTNKPNSLHEWLNATGMTHTAFLKLLHMQTGLEMSKGALSDLLRGARRCSLTKALALSKVTGVPVEKLVEWPTVRNKRIMEMAAAMEAHK